MKVLIASPVPTDPATAGNRTRVATLVSALECLGHQVSFAFAPYEEFDHNAMRSRLGNRLHILQSGKPPFARRADIFPRVRRRLARLLYPPYSYLYDVDEWCDDRLLAQLQHLYEVERFQVALFIYVFMSKLISVLPKTVRTIIDANDLMGDRHRAYIKAGLQPQWFSTTPRKEVQALDRATAVIAIQENEAGYLKQRLRAEVFCVGHIPVPRAMPDFSGARILFLGSANPINIHGLDWFIGSVLPMIRSEIPGCELMIAGQAANERRWPDGVVALGELENVEEAYAQATVVINPALFGTGLAVKSIEALGFGKALVTTAAGARGVSPELSSTMRIAEDDRTFARCVLELLHSKTERNALAKNALAGAHAWRNQQLTNLDAAITGVVA